MSQFEIWFRPCPERLVFAPPTWLPYARRQADRIEDMAQTELLYKSENGDRWFLVREFGAERAFVRHEANLASGGSITDIEIDEFLAAGRAGPEHAALRRLLGKQGGG